MVAFLGYLVPEIVRLPDWEGVASFSQAPNGLAAVRSLPTIVWGLLFLMVYSMKSEGWRKGIHTYISTYKHTYIHTFIHTYIHTYIHTCTHHHGRHLID
jgi:hypothetical protein